MSISEIPKDIWPLILRYLPFEALVNFGATDRASQKLVMEFILQKIRPLEDVASPSLYRRVYNLVEDLKRRAVRHNQNLWSYLEYSISPLEYSTSPFADFETFLNSPALKKIPLMDRIACFSDIPKAIRILLGWQRLTRNWAAEMPNFPMPFEVQDLDAIIGENEHSPVHLMKELLAKARECSEIFKLHEELFKARSILMIWERLVSEIPEEARGDLIQGPGLDQLTRTEEVIAKAAEFKSWFNLRPAIIDHVNDELVLADLGLTYLPDEVCELSHLKLLCLNFNNLTTLPKGIENLKELTALELDWNFFDIIPEAIFQFTQLRGLNVVHNQLTSIPRQIGNLNLLEHLYLAGNQLSSIPPELCTIDPLRTLSLADNQLSSLPPEIVNLTNLYYFHLQNNRLRVIPVQLLNNLNLTIFTDGNLIDSLPLATPRLIFAAAIRNNAFQDNPPPLPGLLIMRAVDIGDWTVQHIAGTPINLLAIFGVIAIAKWYFGV